MEYSNEFKEVINFCKVNNLFLGHGNPNSKILVVGKEQYFDSISELDTDDFYDELIKKRNNINQKNINSWLDNLEKGFIPEWNSSIDSQIINQNALTAY